MHRSPPPPVGSLPPPGSSSRHRQASLPQKSYGRPHYSWKSHGYPNNSRDRPPPPFNFKIELRSDYSAVRKREAEALVEKLKVKPMKFQSFDRGVVGMLLYYKQWVETLDTMVELWESRLSGEHVFIPRLKSLLEVPSDKDELSGRLQTLFIGKLKGLLEGEIMQRWEKKLGTIKERINNVMKDLQKMNSIKIYYELLGKKNGLVKEKESIEKRVEEFKNGIKCMMDYLEGNLKEEQEGAGVRVYKLRREFNWERLHSMMTRECRRLEDGLPIFAFRRQILELIHSQQTGMHLLFILLR